MCRYLVTLKCDIYYYLFLFFILTKQRFCLAIIAVHKSVLFPRTAIQTGFKKLIGINRLRNDISPNDLISDVMSPTMCWV